MNANAALTDTPPGAPARAQPFAAHAHSSPAAVSSKRKRIALAFAAVADLVQLGYFPFFGEGVLSIPDDVLDVIVALLLLATLGFRWRLAFALLLELVPGATLFPTWTAVVLSMPTLPEGDGSTVDQRLQP